MPPEEKKKPWLVIAAFALPLILILGIYLSITIPNARLSTEYNFVYATCTDGNNRYSYRCGNYLNRLYQVEDNQLRLQTIASTTDSDSDNVPDVEEGYRTRLFLHDTKTDISREITLEEAQSYRLNDLITSPDGVSVESDYDRRRADILDLFDYSSSEYGYYLTKGNARKKLNIVFDDDRYYYYRDSFTFIGWVVN